jgi:hypothetical protein
VYVAVSWKAGSGRFTRYSYDIAAALWVGAIILSISALVPINNRIASLNTAAPAPGWERDHRKWDALHRVRILLLMSAFLIVVNALVA